MAHAYEKAGPIPTLGQLQQGNGGKWFWVHCESGNCHHKAPMAIAPLIIRWGPNVSSDKLRRCARCTKCGHKGASLRAPSYINIQVGVQPFPT
jgi:hypothetical protein